jgi:hypothetical protein
MTTEAPYRHARHPASWWGQFAEMSERFDAAMVTEGLADEMIPKITAPLLRREAEIATEVVVRHLNKAGSPELAQRAKKAVGRLCATVERLDERATADDMSAAEAVALCHLLQGNFGEAAARAEQHVGTVPLLQVFVTALRLERFDANLTMRLIRAGQKPADAIECGKQMGKYAWWPDWLLEVVTERAVQGRLDSATVAALDRCAYAELTPFQARIARKLLSGDQAVIDASAFRLENLGEEAAAAKLRDGDLNAVALAARLIPAA